MAETKTEEKKEETELPDLVLKEESEVQESGAKSDPGSESKTETKEEPDPVSEKAKGMGWKPKEQFEGDPDMWVDAGEFIRRQPLFDEIHKYKKRYTELEKNIQKFKEHNLKVEEAAYKRALDTLKAEKLKALEEGDHQAVIEIDERISEAKASKPKPETVQNPFNEWVKENDWYVNDPLKAEYADQAGARYVSMNPGCPPEEAFEYAAKAVKMKFKADFTTESAKPERREDSRSRISAVESGRSAPIKPSKWDQLSDEEKHIAMPFVRDGFITKEKYAEDYLAIKRN